MKPASRQTHRIFVVEDDRKTAASLRLYLEHAGFEVSTAFTGSEALRQAREGSPSKSHKSSSESALEGFS